MKKNRAPREEVDRRRVDARMGTKRDVHLDPNRKVPWHLRRGFWPVMIALLLVLFIVLIILFKLIIPKIREERMKPTPENSPIYYSDLIAFYAEANDIDPFLVAAVMKTESDFRPDVVSNMGAIGLMQILPDTGEWLGQRLGLVVTPEDLYDPVLNIRLGSSFLRYLIQLYDGEESVAIAAYNGGQGNVTKWLKEKDYSDDGRTLKEIPFAETRHYVERVMGRRDRFIEAYEGVFPGDPAEAFDSEEEAEANVNRG